jgi:DNA-binding CsgD family transcriptional regulator
LKNAVAEFLGVAAGWQLCRKRDVSSDPPSVTGQLAQLTQQERVTLQLLGEGHTAKSIAVLTGRSLSSVNESLRRARQKAGVGSSRELARLLIDKKIVDEQIGLSSSTDEKASRRFFWIVAGALIMIISGAAILTAILLMPTQTASSPTSDPLTAQLIPPIDQDPRRLAEVVREEARDSSWADQAEVALRKRYTPLVDDRRIKITRLKCAATTCEVIGAIVEGGRGHMNDTMLLLQASKLNEPEPVSRLKHSAIAFGANNLFAAYWTRSS